MPDVRTLIPPPRVTAFNVNIDMRVRDRLRCLTIILLGIATGCAGLTSAPPAPLAPQWTREALVAKSFRCRPGKCRTTIQSNGATLDVATETREYSPHEIPGWDGGSRARRIASSVVATIARHNGMTTDQTRIGLGTRVVTDADAWTLRCSVLWIDDLELEYNKNDEDHVTHEARRTTGSACRAMAPGDSGAARWRFHSGIAPGRDSLAALYDSLAAEKSPDVSADPPMSLEHLTPAGVVDVRYTLVRDTARTTLMEQLSRRVRLHVRRAAGGEVGIIQTGAQPMLDLAPDASGDEARLLRLLAGFMAISFGGNS